MTDQELFPADMEARLTEHPIGTEMERVCISCGQQYMWTSEPGRQRATIYCSKRCRRRKTPDRRVKRIPLTEESADAANDLALLICARCWLPFGWAPHAESSDDSPPMYHSLSCRDAARRSRKKARAAARKPGQQETQEQREAAQDAEHIAAISAAARELLLPASHCTACGKVASPTKQAAKDAKRAIEQRANRTNEVRYYQCPDGWWHWTRLLDSSFRRPALERAMTESPASRKHRGREGWTVPR
jgi:hypothetical protein